MPSPVGRLRAEGPRDALLGDPEQRHPDHARCRERHPESADLGMLGVDERWIGLEGDVRSEEEELKRDELLRPLLRRVGEGAGRR